MFRTIATTIRRRIAAALRPAPRTVYVLVASGRIRCGDGTWQPSPAEAISPAYGSEAQARAALAAYGRRALALNERVTIQAVAI